MLLEKFMQQKEAYCYICGKTGADSKDHIPPRGIFPRKPTGQLITVKAHRSCNESFQHDDELFRNLIIAACYRIREGKTAWEKQVLYSFKKNPGAKKILRDLIRDCKIFCVNGKNLIYETALIVVQK
jgi:hypothetical protein